MSWYQQNTGLRPQQMPMPAGWEAKYDPTNRRWFYLNHITKTTQWEDPRASIQMQARQPQGQQYGQPTTKAQTETSFMQVQPDATKVKFLTENYGIDEDMAKSMLRTHQNVLSSTETALKTMGYKKVENFVPNESYVDQLHKDYPSAQKDFIRTLLRNHDNKYSSTETALISVGHKKAEAFVLNQHYVDQIHGDYPSATKDLISDMLRRNNNDYMKTVSSLQSQGHAKKIVADEKLVTQFKGVYKDASLDVIRSVLIQEQNNVGRFRTQIEKMGFVKGGKKAKTEKSKPKAVKKGLTQAEKNKMKREMKQKFPHADEKTIEMCLNSTDYNRSVTEMLLQDKEKEKKKTPKSKSYEMPSDDLYQSTTQAPVVFGEETDFPAAPKLELFDMSKLSTSTGPSITSMFKTMQPPKVTKHMAKTKQQARQKKVATAQKKTFKARSVDWKTSENRTQPVGPNPSLRNGPDPSLLISEYVTPMGPNKAFCNGPQPTNRCGPLPSNRNGPANLAVGPMSYVF